MTMIKKRPVEDHPEGANCLTPERLWDETFAAAFRLARTWRLVAMMSWLVAFGAIAGLAYLGSQSKVAAYIVRIDDQLKTSVTQATETRFAPKDAEIEFFLKKFVKDLRTVSSDPFVNKSSKIEAFNYVYGQQAKSAYQSYVAGFPAANSSQSVVKSLPTVDVQLTSVLRASTTSYRIQWIETPYEKNGDKGDSQAYSGLFSYEIVPPSNEKELKANPLGLYLNSISISKDMGK